MVDTRHLMALEKTSGSTVALGYSLSVYKINNNYVFARIIPPFHFNAEQVITKCLTTSLLSSVTVFRSYELMGKKGLPVSQT